MDEAVLAAQGIEPSEVEIGFVDDFGLRIGERATLVRCPGRRAYGAMMSISSSEAAELYSAESVADYLPVPVIVQLKDGIKVEAMCFILPDDDVTGTNREYADSLLELAIRKGLPESYLDEIRQARR